LKSLRPSSFLSRRNPELIPVLATALLLAAAGLQLALPSETALPVASDLAPRRAREPALPIVPNYPEILRNPIFAPDHKPDASVEPPAGGMGDFTVLGIATATDGTATALVKGPDGTIVRVRPGEDMGGWKLVAVELSSLTFEHNGERHILPLEKKPLPPALPLTAPTTAATQDQNSESDQ
jgi:hypothetical protein